MTFASTMQNVIERVIAMEVGAVPKSKAFDNATETAPLNQYYWTNKIGSIATENTTDTDYLMTVMVAMTLHYGWPTQGTVKGQAEFELNWTHIPAVMEYFLSRPRLVNAAGQDPPDCLGPKGITITCSGSQALPNPTLPAGAQEIGARFNLTIPTHQQFKRIFT